MNIIMTLNTVFTIVSVVLLIILLTFYFKNLKNTKSKLLIGLILFTAIFLIQDCISLYHTITMMEYYVPEVEWYVCTLGFLQAVAFSVMLWITWE